MGGTAGSVCSFCEHPDVPGCFEVTVYSVVCIPVPVAIRPSVRLQGSLSVPCPAAFLCHQWSVMCRREEITEIYQMPLLDLVYRAAKVHRMHHDPNMVQKCTLLSIKTGGCPEDCNYCSQSAKHSKETGTKATKLMNLDEVYEAAVRAKMSGSTRFCMGAAWRGPSQVCSRSTSDACRAALCCT